MLGHWHGMTPQVTSLQDSIPVPESNAPASPQLAEGKVAGMTQPLGKNVLQSRSPSGALRTEHTDTW